MRLLDKYDPSRELLHGKIWFFSLATWKALGEMEDCSVGGTRFGRFKDYALTGRS